MLSGSGAAIPHSRGLLAEFSDSYTIPKDVEDLNGSFSHRHRVDYSESGRTRISASADRRRRGFSPIMNQNGIRLGKWAGR
jgi:hypothetical protein